jgi:aldehyde dehydrogenase family protein
MKEQYKSINPYTGELLFKEEPLSSKELVVKIQQMRQTQCAWAALTIDERLHQLAAFKERLLKNKKVWQQMIAEEIGRTLKEGAAEIDKSVKLIDYYLNIAKDILKTQKVEVKEGKSQILLEPLGLIFAVMPWNYPIWQMLRFAIPALCAGNAALIKPAPSVGRISRAFFAAVAEDLPFSYVFLANETVEEAIKESDGFAFTGSVTTGSKLAALAAQYLKKSVLELGGSNAFLVLMDADIKAAAEAVVYSRFRDNGQSCNAAKRVMVDQTIAQEFIDQVLYHVDQLKMGDPQDPHTTLGPLHLRKTKDSMAEIVQEALEQGACCLKGGQARGDDNFYPPTVLLGGDIKARVWQEEVFGPVLPIRVVKDTAEAVSLANNTHFGLGAAIYTTDYLRAEKLAKKLKVGSVYVNRHTSSQLQLPFGGVKDSGYGRELSPYGLLEFLNLKSYWQQ